MGDIKVIRSHENTGGEEERTVKLDAASDRDRLMMHRISDRWWMVGVPDKPSGIAAEVRNFAAEVSPCCIRFGLPSRFWQSIEADNAWYTSGRIVKTGTQVTSPKSWADIEKLLPTDEQVADYEEVEFWKVPWGRLVAVAGGDLCQDHWVVSAEIAGESHYAGVSVEILDFMLPAVEKSNGGQPPTCKLYALVRNATEAKMLLRPYIVRSASGMLRGIVMPIRLEKWYD